MTYSELFNYQRGLDYQNNGKSVSWKVEVRDSALWIYFQESVGLDWFYNFLAWPIYSFKNKLWYHFGLYRVYKSAKDIILQKVKESFYDGLDVKIVGYSHGGGLAQIFAKDVYEVTKVKPTLILYGSMRPFMSKKSMIDMTNNINLDKYISFCNGTDLVPYLPPYGSTLPFNEIGEKFSIWKIFKAGTYHQGYGDSNNYITVRTFIDK